MRAEEHRDPSGPAAVLERARVLLGADAEPTRLTGVHLLRDGDAAAADRAAALVDVLEDPGSYVPHAARAALQTLGVDALPALLAGLCEGSDVVRVGCAWALAVPQGGHAAGVADALAARAGDDVRDVRHAVAAALGRVGAAAERALSALAALSRDADPRVRTEALCSIGRLGAADPSSRHLLVAGLDDPRGEVRAAAVAALRSAAARDGGTWDGLAARVRSALADEPAPHVADDLRALLEELSAA